MMQAEAEDNEGKDPFEAGHIVEVAKDPRTGCVSRHERMRFSLDAACS